MECRRIAIDVAKSVFEVAVSEEAGKVGERRRLSRGKLFEYLARQQPATIVMEACGSAHALGRRLLAMGHRVELLPAQHVRPYVRGDKTDRADAKGLLEARRNEEIRPVPLKTAEQQGLLSLHRVRAAWMGTRNARLHALRGLLREFGIQIPVGARQVLPAVRLAIGDADNEVPHRLRRVLEEICEEVRVLEERIAVLDRELCRSARELPDAARLLTIPGVGPLNATALVASVGDITRFASGRHFASYLGLVPKEHSSGNLRRLGRITKRGDRYLRTLLIHGARSVLRAATRTTTPHPLAAWALALAQRKGHNTAVVALANRLARVVWSVWSQQRTYVRGTRAAA
jgi:transposase